MQRLFLSHIHEEAALAAALKDLIEETFVGMVDVFVSSDSRSLPPGAKWREEVDAALDDAVALIVLCSPVSLSRPWISFETGVGWAKTVPVIPICHSGQTRDALSLPMSSFQALDTALPNFSRNLMDALAKTFGFSKVPPLDFDAVNDAIRMLEKEPDPVEKSGVVRRSNPQYEEIEILKKLAENTRATEASELALNFEMNQERMQYFLDELRQKQLVRSRHPMGAAPRYQLSETGRKLLVLEGLL